MVLRGALLCSLRMTMADNSAGVPVPVDVSSLITHVLNNGPQTCQQLILGKRELKVTWLVPGPREDH